MTYLNRQEAKDIMVAVLKVLIEQNRINTTAMEMLSPHIPQQQKATFKELSAQNMVMLDRIDDLLRKIEGLT